VDSWSARAANLAPSIAESLRIIKVKDARVTEIDVTASNTSGAEINTNSTTADPR
jgi:hypothetical protein